VSKFLIPLLAISQYVDVSQLSNFQAEVLSAVWNYLLITFSAFTFNVDGKACHSIFSKRKQQEKGKKNRQKAEVGFIF
jgi:hypothetical protein